MEALSNMLVKHSSNENIVYHILRIFNDYVQYQLASVVNYDKEGNMIKCLYQIFNLCHDTYFKQGSMNNINVDISGTMQELLKILSGLTNINNVEAIKLVFYGLSSTIYQYGARIKVYMYY